MLVGAQIPCPGFKIDELHIALSEQILQGTVLLVKVSDFFGQGCCFYPVIGGFMPQIGQIKAAAVKLYEMFKINTEREKIPNNSFFICRPFSKPLTKNGVAVFQPHGTKQIQMGTMAIETGGFDINIDCSRCRQTGSKVEIRNLQLLIYNSHCILCPFTVI